MRITSEFIAGSPVIWDFKLRPLTAVLKARASDGLVRKFITGKLVKDPSQKDLLNPTMLHQTEN